MAQDPGLLADVVRRINSGVGRDRRRPGGRGVLQDPLGQRPVYLAERVTDLRDVRDRIVAIIATSVRPAVCNCQARYGEQLGLAEKIAVGGLGNASSRGITGTNVGVQRHQERVEADSIVEQGRLVHLSAPGGRRHGEVIAGERDPPMTVRGQMIDRLPRAVVVIADDAVRYELLGPSIDEQHRCAVAPRLVSR
jgi:hypothetical protein